MTIKVHFDGHVLIPEEPVDLPRGQVLEVDVRAVHTGNSSNLYERGLDMRNGIPVLRVLPTAGIITSEDVRRAGEES